VLTGTLSCSTTATPTSGVGTGYSVILCTGLSASNYAISYVSGGFSVTPAGPFDLVITVSGTQVYGGTPNYTITNYSGFVGTDGPSLVTGTSAARRPRRPPVASAPATASSSAPVCRRVTT